MRVDQVHSKSGKLVYPLPVFIPFETILETASRSFFIHIVNLGTFDDCYYLDIEYSNDQALASFFRSIGILETQYLNPNTQTPC